ncbi:alpha/beta hydrolase family protein [Shewanella livingstonensis]|uniref:Acetylhydrolase n=1 Tax=Shewanella livingstonensis TaxID=150120 RepID=A0A3G8LNT0_9GAMM|nr:alpha/beta hydrolase [Shewanella livingstonensis]AZG71453.1 acetylhydrolase [Shewanella livingstonensis]
MFTKSLISIALLCLGTTGAIAADSINNGTLKKSLVAEQLYPNTLPKEALPELAQTGIYQVGVKTVNLINKKQFNPSTQTLTDRKLTVEVWYPTNKTPNIKPKAVYRNETRLGLPFILQGNATRNAEVVNLTGQPFPLIVLSHGYTGYRTIMFYLAEHLASHGYVVAAIDHTDSTNADVDMVNAPFSGFFSTLLNRSRDQQFTLDYFTDADNFVSSIIDTKRAGLIGYSMGGYGAVNTVGGCYQFTPQTAATFTGSKDLNVINGAITLLNTCAGGQVAPAKVDPKWKAMIAMAPWGENYQLFDPVALAKITTPTLYVAGDLDDISGYKGIKSLYQQTGGDKTYMLTFHNARHNIAPHPAPQIAYQNEIDLGHYFEPAWSNTQLNTINKHFALAMMDCHVKNQQDKCAYLQLNAQSNEQDSQGNPTPAWKGFPHRYATGMSWDMKAAKQ